MKFKLLSDTHFEFFESDDEVLVFIEETLCDGDSHETVLLHAGDLHRFSKLNWVLDELAQRFSSVIYVPGNHEAYGSSVRAVDKVLSESRSENLHILNPGVVRIDNVTIIGATLWTNLYYKSPAVVNEVTSRLSDFSRIEGLTARRFTAMHRLDVAFIRKQLRECSGEKTIVLTHHFPSHQCVNPRFKEFPNSTLNYGFAAELDDLILGSQPDYWLFGHTHDSVDLKIGSTRLMANPYGYLGYEENPEFDSSMIFEL